MDDTFIRERVTSLRMEKGVSERKMSLDLGHSSSYVHSIVCGKALPSMAEFLYMCEYLGVTPCEFFDEGLKSPLALREIIGDMKKLDAKQVESVHRLIKNMNPR